MGLLYLNRDSTYNTRAELFANGEQGLWLDPSQMSTLYQDSNGVTPCTAAGDPVGLILDQSRGGLGALGSELVPGTYTGTVGGTWAIGTTSITRNSSNTSQASLTLGAALSTSKFYVLSFTVSNLSGDTFGFRLGGAGSATQVSANGTYSYRMMATGSNANIIFIPWGGSAGEATITNISVREVPGNHAYQTTSASRPTLARIPSSGRRNVLVRSEEFDNASWLKQEASISQNTAAAPDGTTTADTLIASTNSSNVHRTTQASITVVNGQQYTLSVYAKSDGTYKTLRLGIDSPSTISNFDLENGIASSGTITSVGNGWYRCSVTFTANATTATIRFSVWDTYAKAVADTAYTGTGTNGIFIWGAQLETGSSATNYQKVVATSDVSESGFPDLYHLVFDGSDDSLVTNSVDFSGTDEMTVIAGVRKLSDAADGNLLELTANTNSNTGSFYIWAPEVGVAAYASLGRGTQAASINQRAAMATGTAPDTAVVTVSHDISGDLSSIRRNGVAGTAATGEKGSGNFANAALYIGRRGGSSQPYNGHLYQLIVRGKTTPTGKLLEAERFVARKTGVTGI